MDADEPLVAVENIGATLSSIGLLSLMTFVTVRAIGRYVFGSPIDGVVQFTELILMPLIIFGVMARVQRGRNHISVDLLTRKMSNLTRTVIIRVGLVLALVVIGVMAIQTFNASMSLFERGATVGGAVPIPTGISWLIIASGLALFCLRLVTQLIAEIKAMLGSAEGNQTVSQEESDRATQRGSLDD